MRTVMTIALFGVGLAVAVAAEPPPPAQPPVTDEKKAPGAVDGGYTIVSGERDGKAIPEAEIKGGVVRFTGGRVVGTDKDKKEFFVATYTLDTAKTPWVIDMKSLAPKEATATGLVKKDGDTLTIVYALPGGEAPKEFKTKDKQQMFVLKSFAAEPVKKNKFENPSGGP